MKDCMNMVIDQVETSNEQFKKEFIVEFADASDVLTDRCE